MAARGVVLYDAGCGLCGRARAWLERHGDPGTFRFVGLDTAEARRWLDRCGADPEARDAVWFVEGPGTSEDAGPDAAGFRCAHSSTAFVRMIRHLRRPYRWLRIVRWVPRPLRDLGYRAVARHRHRL